MTVSGQLEGEIFAMAFRDIYTFGPTFRAENSNTARHASEFWMIEPEIAFADLEDDMNLAEDMVKYIISYVLEKAPEEMNFFNSFVDKGLLERLNHVVNSDFERVTYTKAVEILQGCGEKFQYLVESGIDAIWNFSNVKIKVPDGVLVQQEDLTSGYALLGVMMNTRTQHASE